MPMEEVAITIVSVAPGMFETGEIVGLTRTLIILVALLKPFARFFFSDSISMKTDTCAGWLWGEKEY